ncbi:MAG: AAA family ATPase [Acidimicrobiales bacterium]
MEGSGETTSGRFDALIRDAHDRARRLGSRETGLLHLAMAVAQAHPTEFEHAYGDGAADLVAIALERQAVPRADLRAFVERHGGEHGDLLKLIIALRPTVDAVVRPGGPRFAVPGDLARIATVVEGGAPAFAHGPAVDAVLAQIGRRRSESVLIVGPSGSGKSTLIRSIAARLDDPTYHGPLAGGTVVRIGAEQLLLADGAALLAGLAAAAGASPQRVVLAIDDLEVAASLDSPHGADLRLVRAIRAVVGDRGLPVLLTIDAAYEVRLATQFPELAGELTSVTVPALVDGELRALARRVASELRLHHQIEIPSEAVELACSPRGRNDRIEQPGLMVRRLDAACVRAQLEGTPRVDLSHVDVGPSRALTVDPEELRSALSSRIVGQDAAVDSIVERLVVTRRRFDARPSRPDGVFLLAGPSGVGKTALARALAAVLHGDERHLIALDMSEYSQEWSISRLTGPQPGYVGSQDPDGWLTTRVRRKPECVLVFDEIDKAHPAVLDLFLQIFDEGRLTDSRGLTADFSRTIICLTANWGADEIASGRMGFAAHGAAGAEQAATDAAAAIEEHLRVELRNRIDGVIVFSPLAPDSVRAIVARECELAIVRRADDGYDLEIPDDVVELVAVEAHEGMAGVRGLQRAIDRLLMAPLAVCDPGAYRAELAAGSVAWVPVERT